MLWHWVEKASKNGDFLPLGVPVPMRALAEEAAKRFPGRWSGEFAVGARGVRFWDPEADAQSVIVRETGCQCFTGEKPFLTWAEIFGREFVEKHTAQRLGGAIASLFFDGRSYWRQLPNESWQAMNAATAARHLKVKFGLAAVVPHHDTASEVDKVLHQIEQNKAIVGALPFVHNRHSLVRINGRTYLNTSITKCHDMALDPQEWGENFPFIADYLSRLFDPESLQFFLAWLHRFYRSAYDGRLKKGQAVFIAGPVDVGKTLCGERLVGPLVGGKQEATDYLLNNSPFNKELFEYALWTIDDDQASRDFRAHLRFSNLIKKVAANRTFNYHPKFRDALTVPWNGRVFVTCNDDPESIRILPDLELSIRDKIMLFKASDRAPTAFPEDTAEQIEQEMAFFARWLYDFDIPEDCRGTERFGVRSYLDPDLEETAKQSSRTYSFVEILDLWRENHFKTYPGQSAWEGTATALYQEMLLDESIKPLVERDYTNQTVGGRLNAMMNQGYSCVRFRKSTKGKRMYTIQKPKPPPAPDENEPF